MSNRQVSFGQQVQTRLRLRDVAVLLFVPALLLALFSLPASVRLSLAFNYNDPSLPTAFTSAFVHLDRSHLAVNLAGYALIVPLTYLMSTVCGYRQRFYVSFATYILVFPLALTLFQILFIRPGIGLGFSGVLMAFYGYLPLAMGDFISEQFDVDVQTNVAPLLFFLGIGIITVLGVFPSLDSLTVLLGSAGLLLAIVVILLWYVISILDDNIAWRATVAEAWGATGYLELFVVSIVVFLAFPFAMFPRNVATGSAFVDTYTHLLAYSLGFIATYTSSHLSTLVADENARSWM